MKQIKVITDSKYDAVLSALVDNISVTRVKWNSVNSTYQSSEIETLTSLMIEECNGVLGTDWSGEDIVNIGLDIMKIEREFNEAAGFTKADDRLPEFMKYEKLPPHDVVWDVPDEMLDSVCEF